MKDFALATTGSAVAAVWAANACLEGGTAAFIPGLAQSQTAPLTTQTQVAARAEAASFASQPATVMRAALGAKGLMGFGMGFGAMAALVRGSTKRTGRRTARQAGEAEIQKSEVKVSLREMVANRPALPYLDNIPPAMFSKETIERVLANTPREDWENPPEGCDLYKLKCYAEVYGEGKATRMGWFDFWYLKVDAPEVETYVRPEDLENVNNYVDEALKGHIPVFVPGPAGAWYTGATIQIQGAEKFAGDQFRTPVTDGRFAKQFVNSLAFYREGLKPWQRGIEIGMAHGYFIIGPFVTLGPLRNTPEAATVGLLAGCALIGIVSVGGLLFGATIKPTLFDKEGDAPAAGYQEMINWHALGGIGGAGFAHALITVFGS